MKPPELLKPENREEAALLEQLDARRLPQHIAIIMDGNGRWAQKRHLPRIAGHRAGVQSARTVIETCARMNIPALTLYAFSLENWRRPQAEIDFLMRLLRQYLRKELPVIHRNNIRLQIIGRADQLPAGVQADVEKGMALTRSNTGMTLAVALNYGGRAELVDAFNAIFERVRKSSNGHLANFEVNERMIEENLYTAGMPDPDLLIRTSGEMRVSNFLLWQIAYAEIYVTETLWPDFTPRGALRRAGGIPEAGAALRRAGDGREARARCTRRMRVPSRCLRRPIDRSDFPGHLGRKRGRGLPSPAAGCRLSLGDVPAMNFSPTAVRVATAVILIPVVVAAVWWGSTGLVAGFAGLVTLLALLEFFALGEHVGLHGYRIWTCMCALAVIFQQWAATEAQSWRLADNVRLTRASAATELPLELVLFIFVLGAAAIALLSQTPLSQAIGDLSISAAGLLFIALPFSARGAPAWHIRAGPATIAVHAGAGVGGRHAGVFRGPLARANAHGAAIESA